MTSDDIEVHAFRGEATVGDNELGYEPGTRHAVIVFSRNPPPESVMFKWAASWSIWQVDPPTALIPFATDNSPKPMSRNIFLASGADRSYFLMIF